MKFVLSLIVAALLAGCGGGGCDAGKPGFESVRDECEDRAEEADPAASAPAR
jgi:hypothetical protein